MQTADLWCWKQLLYQLNHYHCQVLKVLSQLRENRIFDFLQFPTQELWNRNYVVNEIKSFDGNHLP